VENAGKNGWKNGWEHLDKCWKKGGRTVKSVI
jgi:hypothetical protein